jgi:hypothetical protein
LAKLEMELTTMTKDSPEKNSKSGETTLGMKYPLAKDPLSLDAARSLDESLIGAVVPEWPRDAYRPLRATLRRERFVNRNGNLAGDFGEAGPPGLRGDAVEDSKSS